MATTETPAQIVALVRGAAARFPGDFPDLSDVTDERIIEVANRPGVLRDSWHLANAAVSPAVCFTNVLRLVVITPILYSSL